MRVIPKGKIHKDGKLADLFFEQTFSSWQEFLNHLMNRKYDESVLWRGQADASWEVVPSYTRDVERKIKAMVPDGSEDYDEKVLLLRRERAFQLSRNYHELLFNSPANVLGDKVNAVQYFFKPPMLQTYVYDMYIEIYERFVNKRVIGLNNQIIQSVGSCYDMTFGTDIDISKWTWGQHYGVATPLVDWTRCALVALFFACCSECKADKIAVYALDINKLGEVNQITAPPQVSIFDILQHPTSEVLGKLRQFFLTFFKGLTIEITLKQQIPAQNCISVFNFLSDMKKLKLLGNNWGDNSNGRLNAQAAFFTFTPGGISIEDWCKRFYEVHKGGMPLLKHRPPMLTKYIIPMSKKDKKNCMRFLEEANINFKTVYPDFQGISKYLEQTAKR
jgi:hypothetical protein